MSVNKIIKKIGCQYLSLVKGDLYWYFIFDDGVRYETHSVYCMFLNQLPLDQWIDEGKEFIKCLTD
jgi:hypothetical protein